jgi:hypothetical protein
MISREPGYSKHCKPRAPSGNIGCLAPSRAALTRSLPLSKQPNLIPPRRVLRCAPQSLLVAALAFVLLLSGATGLARSQQRTGHIRGAAQRSPHEPLLTVDATHTGKPFASGAVGLSIEAEELATHDLDMSDKSLVALMRLLGPSVLRIGGNSLDYSWWTSRDEQSPAWATNTVTPGDLVTLRELLSATGWHVILGVDLGHFDPMRAADEAHIARLILGGRLLGIEIGNEPNGYSNPSIGLRGSTYSVTAYLKDLSEYSAAIRAAAPSIHLYGPEVSVPTTWLTPIASDANLPFAELTEHFYPTTYSVPRGACKGTPIPTPLELLSSRVRERENNTLEVLIADGALAHIPTRISETNTTASCDASGAPETGPVFASALWSLDWALRAAEAGVSGINFHGSFSRCLPATFSPICTATTDSFGHAQVIARPEYYGFLAARQLEGGRFVPVDIARQDTVDDFTAYATVHAHGAITLAIDNFAPRGLSLLLQAPGYTHATDESLTGPSISATSDVTFGHAQFSSAGVLRPITTRLSHVDHHFPITLSPASAIVITLRKMTT